MSAWRARNSLSLHLRSRPRTYMTPQDMLPKSMPHSIVSWKRLVGSGNSAGSTCHRRWSRACLWAYDDLAW